MTQRNIDEVTAYLAAYGRDNKIPGLQVCVYEDGEPVIKQSYGVKNGNKEPLANDTVMGIASITKTITALAFSLLCSEGKASAHDSVVRYFPNLKIPGTPVESLLVGHLLNHTSGIPALALHSWCVLDHTEPDEWERDIFQAVKSSVTWKSDTIEDIVTYLSESGAYEPLGQPGMYFSYLNEGYALIAAIVARVACVPFEAYVAERIFAPLEMTHSSFHPRSAEDSTSLFVGVSGPASDLWYSAPPYLGTGYAVSTADEIARLLCALSAGGQYKGAQVFPKDAVDRLFGEAFPLTEQGVYCYGVHKRRKNGGAMLRHNGALKGVTSTAGFLASGGRSYAILANIEGARIDELENKLQNLISDCPIDTPPYTPAPLPGQMPKHAQAYAGSFFTMEDMGYSIDVCIRENGMRCVFGSAVGGKSGEVAFLYCGTTVFLEETELPVKRVLSFIFDHDVAIGVQYGGRFFQRRK